MKPIPPCLLDLPLRVGPVRFAVGAPDGLSSNSWQGFWATSGGDAYLSCRDNFQEVKVSLHASGRWRMAFTAEALAKDPSLVPPGADRVWEVWDEPSPTLPNTIAAFRLIFPTSELAVAPAQRSPKQWRDTVYIEAAPAGSGKLTVVTLFVTIGDPELRHDSEPSFRLASLDLGAGRRGQLVAQVDPEGEIPQIASVNRRIALARALHAGVENPDEGYLYFFGNQPDGVRFIVGARARAPA